MRVFLQDGPSRIQILSPSHVRDFRDVGAARDFLRPFLASAGNAIAIRTALAHERGAVASTDEALLDELAARVVTEGLWIVSCADSHLAAVHGTFVESTEQGGAEATVVATSTTPLQDEDAAAEERAAAAATDEKHWIEIELVDDDGMPVAGERYVVELPDGTMITGTTGSDGKARVDNVPKGTAKVSFPDRDKAAYEPQ